MKKVSISLVIALAALVLGIYGCGNSSEPQPPKKPAQKTTAKKPAATPTNASTKSAVDKAKPTIANQSELNKNVVGGPSGPNVTKNISSEGIISKITPLPSDFLHPISGEINVASLKLFEKIVITPSSDGYPNGYVLVPFLDGAIVNGPDGQSTKKHSYWTANIPASLEVKFDQQPNAPFIHRVEIEDFGQRVSFGTCKLFSKVEQSSDWTEIAIKDQHSFHPRETHHGVSTRFIYIFDPLKSSAVKLEFPTGGEKYPQALFVSDVDIYGLYR